MTSKTIFVFCASALFVQALGQYISPGAVVSGNSVVDNTIVLGNSGLAGSGYGLAGSGIGLAGSGIGLAGSGYGLAGSGYGLAGSGIGLAGSGIGLAGSGIGLAGSGIGLSSGLAGAGASGVVVGSVGGRNVVSSGPLLVTSISPIGPSGLAIASENAIEGVLAVSGQLPFLSAVAFEGSLPTAGSGVATCGCGSGNVGIVSEGLGAGVGRGRGGLYY